MSENLLARMALGQPALVLRGIFPGKLGGWGTTIISGVLLSFLILSSRVRKAQKQRLRSELTPILWVKNFNVSVSFFKVEKEIIPKATSDLLHPHKNFCHDPCY